MFVVYVAVALLGGSSCVCHAVVSVSVNNTVLARVGELSSLLDSHLICPFGAECVSRAKRPTD